MVRVNPPKDTLLERLVRRGDGVSVVNGQLSIIPASGKQVTEEWLASNSEAIIKQIMNLQQTDYFSYDGYSTGRFNQRFEGVKLDFVSLKSGKTSYAIFNCSLRRKRNTKQHNAGSPLPKGQFTVTAKHGFVSFWRSTGLRSPKSHSSYHDYMGKLKKFYFSGTKSSNGKLSNATLHAVDVTYEDILKFFSLPDSNRTTTRQSPDTIRIAVPDKESLKLYAEQGIASVSGTCTLSQDNKLTRKDVDKEVNVSFQEILNNQSVDEWVADAT